MTRPPRDPYAVAIRTIDLSRPLRPLADVSDMPAYDCSSHGEAVRLAMWKSPTTINPSARRVSAMRLPQSSRPSSCKKGCGNPSPLLATYRARQARQRCRRISRFPWSSPRTTALTIYVTACAASHSRARLDPLEIIVVDNHPTSGATPSVATEFPGVVLLMCHGRAICARNRGIRASHGDIVVTTDDDVTMPPDWLETLLSPFVEHDVMAVTGNILPLELETASQRHFEAYGGLGRGFERLVVDGNWFRQFRSAVPTWTLGATANAAFRATIFAQPQIGFLDETLGPGTPAGCGEDTYLFYKILKANWILVYEPSAFVFHKHRRDLGALR